MRKYFIFLATITLFTGRSLTSNSFGSAQLIPAPYASNSVPFPCHNSDLNQTLISWTSTQATILYMIYNADSTVAVNLQYLDSGNSSANTNISSIYNSHKKQYFITWPDLPSSYIKFAFIDSQGSLQSVHTTSFSLNFATGYAPNVNVVWNSNLYQYLIYWFDGNPGSSLHYAILDEDGNIVADEQTLDTAVSDGGFFGSYNADLNEYFIPLITSDPSNYVSYAILSSSGELIKTSPPGFVTSAGSNSISSAYNSKTGQYFLVWLDRTSYKVAFAISDNQGNLVQQSFLDFISTNNGNFGLSYNSANNQFVVTALNADLASYPPSVLICDAEGNSVSPVTSIPNVTAAETISPSYSTLPTVFNTYSSIDNKIFISWLSWLIVPLPDYPGGFPDYPTPIFNTYSIAFPPPTPSNFKGKRSLNRFANYGEYVNTLSWSQSTKKGLSYYNLYRNGAFLTVLPSDQTSYEEHNQPNKKTTYTLKSVNENGEESSPTSITF